MGMALRLESYFTRNPWTSTPVPEGAKTLIAISDSGFKPAGAGDEA